MAIKYLNDRLYFQIPVSNDDLRLYQTREMTRLREVSLSAIPPWVLPCGLCATKFEHSVGVEYLARIVCEQHGFSDQAINIRFAALGHDVGTPPFSHMSEYYLKLLHGKDHEEFAEDVLLNSELSEEMTRQGGNVETITRMITGKYPPLSDIVNGSIDVDNLDNSLRYCISMGLVNHPTYSPVTLASSYRFSESRGIYLDERALPELPGWEECRSRTYSFVYSDRNLAPGSMLHRAMDLATRIGVDEIPPEFFRMTDSAAYQWLLTKCNSRTRNLAECVQHFQQHELVVSATLDHEDEALAELISTPWSRGILADEVADELSISPESVSVYHGKNKGYKAIHLPILDDAGSALPMHQSILHESWYLRIFVDPAKINQRTKSTIRRLLEKKLTSLQL